MNKLNKKEYYIFGALLLIFIIFHVFGLYIPYHQDEYKWPMYANPALSEAGVIPHPPLTEFLYRIIGYHIGYTNFRWIPFFFGLLNFFLIFYLAKIISGKKTAFLTLSLFTFSFYSLLASLMVDVDGAVMPFFFLLLSISYFKLKERNFDIKNIFKKDRYNFWWALLLVGAFGGFLIKVSAILPVCAFALDFLFYKNVFSDRRKIFKYFVWLFLGAISFVLLLFLAKLVFPFFKLEYAFKYWEHFVVFKGRNWFQTFIQFAKSVLYLSPLLTLTAFFADTHTFKKFRPFFFFIFFGLFFYLVAFDFSLGALDRYFQFLVIPLCLISASIFIEEIKREEKYLNFALLSLCVAVFIVLLQFIPQFVPSLHPKSAWISRILSFKWNFLYPFSGGSGPIGFYISFMVLGLSWIFTAFSGFLAKVRPNIKTYSLIFIFILGLSYNFVFTEEYLFGFWNGNASRLLEKASVFIKDDPDVKKVTVYNDNGGFEIQATGKYRKRLYTDPAFDAGEKAATLNQYKEHYFVLDVPRIDPNSFYQKYFDSCKAVYKDTDKYMSATVFDCRNAPDVLVK